MRSLLLHNGRIRTLDARQPVVSALAIRDGKIVAAGSNDHASAAVPKAERVNLEGRDVLPGLTDAHLHFEWYALGLQAVDAETATLDEALRRVAERAARTAPGAWITGYGWNQNEWGGRFPTAADLDRVASDQLVFLKAKSGHAGWANSAALRRAGLTEAGLSEARPNPPGGEIVRDTQGRPTGILFEGAMQLIDKLVPAATTEAVAQAMLPAMENAWRAGLTGVHDFDGARSFAAWQMVKARGQLGLRVVKTIPVRNLPSAITLGLRTGFGDDWLRVGNVKVFLDGALGPRTAAMIGAYEGEPNNYGIVVTDKEELYENATQAAEHGLAMTVHAIGDKANHDLLDVYAVIRGEERERGQAPLRHRCEHVQLLHPDDWQRLAELQVVASMQPIHATSDMRMADQFWGERSVGAYALRTQLDAGAPLAFGSDCPVESFNPFWGIHAAVTRRRGDGTPGPEGWYPEQRLTVDEAVRGFTLGAAYAGYAEQRLGSLEAGKLADLIVVDRDLWAVDPMAIRDTRVLGTLVDGAWKFRNF